MNREEAVQIAEEWLAKFRSEPYAALVARIDAVPLTDEVTLGDKRYQLELVCAWDSEPEGNVRVMANIDDGGLRAFVPLCCDFIKRSDGSVVDEQPRSG